MQLADVGLSPLSSQEALSNSWASVVKQIDSAHLNILKDSRIQDGHHEEWEQDYVANVVRKEVRRLLINTVRAVNFCPHAMSSAQPDEV